MSEQASVETKKSPTPWLYYVGKFFVRVFVYLRFGLHIKGLENVPREGGVLVVSNHRTGFDPPVVGLAFPRVMSYMAKKELFEHWFFGWLFRQLQAFPVDRSGNASSAVKESIRRLRGGAALLIFAEGTRNQGEAKALDGAAFIAQRANVPLLPTAVYQRGRRFYVHFGTPILPEGSSRDETRRLTEKVMEDVRFLLPLDYRLAKSLPKVS
ncbi:MAG: 1-acyl-sn-glycerol-3-phosphate acyltransferase [Trueperaceae bacterium]|nr:1-acyl-sn-glycerol-3-phosphate acyltransferase [Trueperaceae bacterium]